MVGWLHPMMAVLEIVATSALKAADGLHLTCRLFVACRYAVAFISVMTEGDLQGLPTWSGPAPGSFSFPSSAGSFRQGLVFASVIGIADRRRRLADQPVFDGDGALTSA